MGHGGVLLRDSWAKIHEQRLRQTKQTKQNKNKVENRCKTKKKEEFMNETFVKIPSCTPTNEKLCHYDTTIIAV